MQPAENQRQKENLDRSQVKKKTKLTYTVGKIKCILDFSSEAIQARRQ